MERLTTNKDVSEMSMMELAYNSCYTKGGKARYRDYDLDVDARVLTRMLLKNHADGDDAFTCDEDFDDLMADYLQYGTNELVGLIALFYRNLWAMADLRERLKKYEDLEEQGKLLITAYNVKEYPVGKCPDCERKIYRIQEVWIRPELLGDGFYWTKEEAERALKEMEEGNYV